MPLGDRTGPVLIPDERERQRLASNGDFLGAKPILDAVRDHGIDKIRTLDIGLIDDRVLRRTNRNEQELDRKPDRQQREATRHDRRFEQRAPAVRQNEDHERGARQQGHRVVGRADPEDQCDQEQDSVAARSVGLVQPEHGEVTHEGDDEQRNGVDLLVQVRLTPDRERSRADPDRRDRGDQHLSAILPEMRHDSDNGQEPEERRGSRQRRAKHIDPEGHRQTRPAQENLPRAPDEDEERISGRVRHPEEVRGGDVLRGIPKPRRRGERKDVETPHQKRGDYTPRSDGKRADLLTLDSVHPVCYAGAVNEFTCHGPRVKGRRPEGAFAEENRRREASEKAKRERAPCWAQPDMLHM